MRVCLEFNIKGRYLPIDYRRCFVSFIKKALSISNNGIYMDQYYSDTKQKPFSFTVVMNKPKFGKKQITFEGNKIRMYFSIIDREKIGYIFVNCFLKMKYISFSLPDDNEMCLVNVANVREQKIVSNHVSFRTSCSSSILVREHDRQSNRDKYYTCEDEGYIEKLEENIKWQCLQEGYSASDVNQIKVEAVHGKKVVMRHYAVLIDGTSGTFEVTGPIYLLNYLYRAGFGSKRSFGFAYLEVINRKEGEDENIISRR